MYLRLTIPHNTADFHEETMIFMDRWGHATLSVGGHHQWGGTQEMDGPIASMPWDDDYVEDNSVGATVST